MPPEDSQPYDSQPRQWAALQHRQQPLYTYPQPPEDGSHLSPPSVSHEHASHVGLSSFNFGPSYDQISPPSPVVVPSSAQYPHVNNPQSPYAPYPNSGYPGHQQSRSPHDYFSVSAVPAVTKSSYPTTSVSSAYNSPSFPHRVSELGHARDYNAQTSLPTVTTPDTVVPAFSASDAPYYHTQIPAVSNKRQRPEEQEEDAGDVNAQTCGDIPMSTVEKLKRACARCRGLKVCHPTGALSRVGF